MSEVGGVGTLNRPHGVHRVTEGPGGGGTSLCADCCAESLQIMMRGDFIQTGLSLLSVFVQDAADKSCAVGQLAAMKHFS